MEALCHRFRWRFQLILPEGFNQHAAAALLQWFHAHGVSYPWGDSPDPWGVWVSEVMLQQTTVASVKERYQQWMKRFPNPETLSAASEEEILREWEGLGYYNRARNLAAAAAEVQSKYGGEIPDSLAELRSLPGVGEYIASAVASFAFGQRTVAIDANGRRIAQRISAQKNWNRALESEFRCRVERLMLPHQPAEMNAALMQLGQQICTPKKPRCAHCPLAECCLAWLTGQQEHIPATLPLRTIRMESDLALLIVSGTVLLRQANSGIARGLWMFPRAEEIPQLATHWIEIGRLKETLHTYTKYRELLRPVMYRPVDMADKADTANSGRQTKMVRVTLQKLESMPMPSAYRRIADLLAAHYTLVLTGKMENNSHKVYEKNS